MIIVMGVIIPLTLGVASSASIAFVYKTSSFEMSQSHAMMWGVGQTVIHAFFGSVRFLATLWRIIYHEYCCNGCDNSTISKSVQVFSPIHVHILWSYQLTWALWCYCWLVRCLGSILYKSSERLEIDKKRFSIKDWTFLTFPIMRSKIIVRRKVFIICIA